MEARQSLDKVSSIVETTIDEIYSIIKKINSKNEKDKVISEICSKYNINESHIRLVGDFFNDNKKKLFKKVKKEKDEE